MQYEHGVVQESLIKTVVKHVYAQEQMSSPRVLAFVLLYSYSFWKYIYKQLCNIKISKRARTWIKLSFPGFHTEKFLLLTTFSNVCKILFQR